MQEKDLHRWRLIEAFERELAEVVSTWGGLDPDGTWADPRRKLALGDYLSLHLFGLFNPVVKTLRGLAAASQLGRVQDEVCSRPVSLGSLSEAQAVVDPGLLEAVFARLQGRASPAAAGFAGREVVIDSTGLAADGVGVLAAAGPGAERGAPARRVRSGAGRTRYEPAR